MRDHARPLARSRTARFTLAAAVAASAVAALLAAPAHADPLAVHMPDVEGTGARGRPTHSQWMQVADAVSAALAQRLPDVLAGSETASRITLLDPAQLLCDSARCAHDLVGLLHVRGVVLVRAALDGHTLRLELEAVGADGASQRTVRGEATIGDWTDAVALGRVLGVQLASALAQPSPAATNPPTGSNTAATPANDNPAAAATRPGSSNQHERSPAENPGGASVPEVAAGAVLFVGGAVAAVIGGITLAGGTQCGPDEMHCHPAGTVNPSPEATYSSPSDLNWAWVIGGGVVAIGGAILAIHGLSSGGSARASSARHAPRITGAVVPGGAMAGVTFAF